MPGPHHPAFESRQEESPCQEVRRSVSDAAVAIAERQTGGLFWSTGYWRSHLSGPQRRRHISLMSCSRTKSFRRTSVGDGAAHREVRLLAPGGLLQTDGNQRVRDLSRQALRSRQGLRFCLASCLTQKCRRTSGAGSVRDNAAPPTKEPWRKEMVGKRAH